MSVEFEHVTEIDAPVEVVFDMSLSIDVHLDSMSASRERAIAGVTSGQIGLGEQVTWRAWPHRFVDQEVRADVWTDRPSPVGLGICCNIGICGQPPTRTH